MPRRGPPPARVAVSKGHTAVKILHAFPDRSRPLALALPARERLRFARGAGEDVR